MEKPAQHAVNSAASEHKPLNILRVDQNQLLHANLRRHAGCIVHLPNTQSADGLQKSKLTRMLDVMTVSGTAVVIYTFGLGWRRGQIFSPGTGQP